MAEQYVDIKTLKYLLFNVYDLEQVLNLPYFADHDSDSINIFLDSVKDFSDKELYPYFKEMDEDPARFENGKIITHPQVEVMMKKGGEMGFIAGMFDYAHGGMQLPGMVHTASTYIQDAANNHLPGYPGLTIGAAELIAHFASQELRDKYLPNMLSGNWGGTMCLTEPQAGSSLSDIVTTASPTPDGYYSIKGQKIFISAGDHEYADNFVHLTLARIDGAPSGTKGISLFVIPKFRPTENGHFESNDVVTAGDFQKMGQRGYCTTHLMFGESNNCRGWLVGAPHHGLKYMFMMMNSARIGVGRGAAAITMAAYLASLQYANERAQGRLLNKIGKKDAQAEQTLIINHPDVRRMLLLQKVVSEGSLALVLLASKYQDLSKAAESDQEKSKYKLLLEILTPIVKTYPSEMGIISVSNGVQILGGYGFTSEFILQQYYRDIRISAIYEGTTGIQSLDLLGRKLGMQDGKATELLMNEILQTIERAGSYEPLAKYALILQEKQKLFQDVVDHLMKYADEGDYVKFTADANLFLEMLSHILIGWIWLDISIHAHVSILQNDKSFDESFYESKIHAMKFFFKYELAKTSSLAESLKNTEILTIKKDNKIFV